MNVIINESRNAIAVSDGALIVGNHDSITLFGAQSQAHLKEHIIAITKIAMPNADDDKLEIAINKVIKEIETFEARTKIRFKTFGRTDYHKTELYIEQAISFFQIQQMKLIKELKLLDKLYISIHEDEELLCACIDNGSDILQKRTQIILVTQSITPVDDEGLSSWYSRLSKRIEDLRISHTLALQTQSQIKLLREANLALIDRIDVIITNILPAWQSQLNTLLGIQKYKKWLNRQDDIMTCSKLQSLVGDLSVGLASIININNTLKRELATVVSNGRTDVEDS